jgi:hypothetical protein
MSRNNQNLNDLLVNNIKLETMDNFMFLGVYVKNKNKNDQE